MTHPYFSDHAEAVVYYERALVKERSAALDHVRRIKELEELVEHNRRLKN
jgi:hypothetical protein